MPIFCSTVAGPPRSGHAAAKARGKRLGRQPGQRPKSDRLVPKVLALVAQGRIYRLLGRELGLSKNTVAAVVKRAWEGRGGGAEDSSISP